METDQWIAALEQRLNADLRRRRPSIPRELTVLFDPGCALCRHCRAWMLGQPAYVKLEFLPATSAVAQARFGDLPWLGDELIVIGDSGEVWVGPAAFLTCLWALVEWRDWSFRLAGSSLSGIAERFFWIVSKNRASLAMLLGHHECKDGSCAWPDH
jgi:predicted DCC family thiol-disulfide oxidoreductase YuxK